MNPSTVIAIAAIVVSGVIGPWISSRLALGLQERGYRRDREMTDLAEVRRLVDEVSAAIQSLYSEIPSFLERGITSESDGLVSLAPFDAATGKLRTRLGNNAPIVKALEDGQAVLWDFIRVANDENDRTDNAKKEPLFTRFATARNAFTEEATALVAVLLPPSHERRVPRLPWNPWPTNSTAPRSSAGESSRRSRAGRIRPRSCARRTTARTRCWPARRAVTTPRWSIAW